MKNTCKHRRNRLGFGIFALAAFVSSVVHANPFNDGTTSSITNDTPYDEILFVGIQNPDNILLIQSNATVSATELIIGQLTSSTNNLVDVANGSRLIVGATTTNGLTTGGIVVGDADGDPAVSVRNGSTLNGDYLYIGYGTNDSGKIVLSGKGTEINVKTDAFVGYAGSTNTINVGSGATLNIGGGLNVGYAGGSNNTVVVNSGGTLFLNSTNDINVVDFEADNNIDIQENGTLQIGGDVETGTLEADLGVKLASKAKLEVGGTLSLTGNQINDRLAVVLNGTLSTNTATWSSSSVTFIGDDTSNNSLTLTNGATGSVASILQIGSSSTAGNNALNLGGTGTILTAGSDVMVGAQGNNNTLALNDSAQATIAGNLYLGNNSGATGNEVSVGSNSVLNVGSNVTVGDYASNNSFTINKGQVNVANDFTLGSGSIGNTYNQIGGTNTIAGNFILGKEKGASGATETDRDISFKTDSTMTSGNLAFIGSNAVVNIGQDLNVGTEGDGSVFVVRDGGVINLAGNAVIGENSADNVIYLQRGSNTQFNVDGNLIVGKEGGSNRLAAYGGTANIGGSLYLGASTNQHEIKNFIHLQTTNAVLNVANALHIGASNSVNTLDLVAGATATATDLFVGAYDGVTNNVVTVTGNESLLSITNMVIGSNSGSNNAVNVNNGGTLYVENITIATSNMLTVADGGILKTLGWDFASADSNIVFESGATLHLLGLLEGTNMVEGGLNFVLDGTNSMWNAGTNALYVGFDSTYNSLTVTNGATVSTSTNLYLGNPDSNASGYNRLFAMSGGMIEVGGDMFVARDAMLKIDSKSQVHVVGDYEQDSTSTLEVGISSNATLPNLEIDGKANLESGTTLAIYDDGIGDNTNVAQTVVMADELTIGDETATSSLLDNINIQTNLLLDFSVWVSNSNMIVVDNFITRSISEGAELDGALAEIAGTIDLLADDTNNVTAVAMRKIIQDLDSNAANEAFHNYYGEKESASPAHNLINHGLQGVAEQLTMRADNTRSRISEPAGAAGPHSEGQELQGWISAFSTWIDQGEDNGFGAYDGDVRGHMIGADFSVAEQVLIGVAGGRSSGDVEKENGATTETDTSYGAAYITVGTKSWFADASIIYGSSSVEQQLGTAFDTTASYDAKNMAVYLGLGKEITGDYLIFTPQVSVLANQYEQDEYTEEASNAIGREVDSFDQLYLQSSIGFSLGMYMSMGEMTFKPEIRAHWLHEFGADDESIPFNLIGQTDSYSLALQAPEKDIFKIGIGTSAKLGEYLELRADIDTRQSASYSDTTVLGSLRYQF